MHSLVTNTQISQKLTHIAKCQCRCHNHCHSHGERGLRHGHTLAFKGCNQNACYCLRHMWVLYLGVCRATACLVGLGWGIGSFLDRGFGRALRQPWLLASGALVSGSRVLRGFRFYALEFVKGYATSGFFCCSSSYATVKYQSNRHIPSCLKYLFYGLSCRSMAVDIQAPPLT